MVHQFLKFAGRNGHVSSLKKKTDTRLLKSKTMNYLKNILEFRIKWATSWKKHLIPNWFLKKNTWKLNYRITVVKITHTYQKYLRIKYLRICCTRVKYLRICCTRVKYLRIRCTRIKYLRICCTRVKCLRFFSRDFIRLWFNKETFWWTEMG